MNERRLRNLLLQHPLPDEPGAEERAWAVLERAFAAGEPLPARRRVRWRLLAGVALLAAAIGVGASPAGPAIGSWVREKVGKERVAGIPGQPALLRLPAPGRLLVVSPKGVWVVSEDGGRRFLGRYQGATWSPRGAFVAAWDGKQVVALDPNVTGGFRWARPAPPVLGARWSPSGYRIAYLSGRTLHVVAGDNTNDRVLAAPVAPVLPAWRPGAREVLAYADPDGRLVAVNADTRRTLWRTPRAPRPLALAWSDDGRRLAALSEHRLRLFSSAGALAAALDIRRAEGQGTSLALRPATHEAAFAVYERASGRSTVFLFDGRSSRRLFAGAGRIDDLAWSPDGRFLLVPWRAADELLFVPVGRGRVLASANAAEQFAPGAVRPHFPRIAGWCCSPEGRG